MSRNPEPNLQPFDIIETEVVQPIQVRKFSIVNTIFWVTFNVLTEVASLAWLITIILYGTMPRLPGPVNAWAHRTAFKVFMAFGILYIIFLVWFKKGLLDLIRRVWPRIISTMRYFQWIMRGISFMILIFGIMQTTAIDPVIRSCKRDFPVHFKLDSDHRVGYVEVFQRDGRGIWDMKHQRVGDDIYSLQFNGVKRHDGELFRNVSWPDETAVREVLYDLTPGKKSVYGFCGGSKKLCLNGTIDTNPLGLHWTYFDPLTFEREDKSLESEGRWYYGRDQRPLVDLTVDGKVVFRAPSSRVVCGAGDHDFRTAVVPVGMIMIAEQKFRGR